MQFCIEFHDDVVRKGEVFQLRLPSSTLKMNVDFSIKNGAAKHNLVLQLKCYSHLNLRPFP